MQPTFAIFLISQSIGWFCSDFVRFSTGQAFDQHKLARIFVKVELLVKVLFALIPQVLNMIHMKNV